MTKYHFPPIELLKDSTESSKFQRLEYIQRLRDNLNGMFEAFKIDAKVVDYHYNNFAILLKVKLGQGIIAPAVVKLKADIELICSLLRIQKKKNCTSEGSNSNAEKEYIA